MIPGYEDNWPDSYRSVLREIREVSVSWPNARALAESAIKLLRQAGLQVHRMRLGIEVTHPSLFSIAWDWDHKAGFREHLVRRNILNLPMYRQSPVRPVKERTLPEVRISLTGEQPLPAYNLVPDLVAEGFTDYVALPLRTATARDDVISFATQDSSGFSNSQLALFRQLAIEIQPYSALHAARLLTRTIAEIYLGKRTGSHVASGDLQRGSLRSLNAAVWIIDIRDFTAMSDTHEPSLLIEALNVFFEEVHTTITRHGGEILKFMGDAALVVFPDDNLSRACQRSLAASQEFMDRWPLCYEGPNQAFIRSIQYGVGLHCGQVLYGNVGAKHRLDFTVIGRDVNLTARLAELCASFNARLVCSQRFNRHTDEALSDLGNHELKGFKGRFRIFGRS